MNINQMNRRGFLKASALAGGGLMLELTLPTSVLGQDLGTLVGSKELNVYVQIASDGKITIYSANPEMGQGIKTSLPMIIAEEMGAKWEDVVVLQAPINASKYGLQGAGGSTSIPRNFDMMRQMGASAREMLIGAASESMEVERQDLTAQESTVVHTSGQSLTFGELAALAVRQPIPDPATLSYKDPRAYTIIGTSVGGVDNLVIVTGQSEFGIDVDLDGMKYAAYTRCPRVGGRAISFNEVEIKQLPGIIDAFILEPDDRSGLASRAFLEGLAVLRGGVAIIGEDTWAVFDAKSKLKVAWDETSASSDDWLQMVAEAKKIASAGGGEVSLDGATVDLELNDKANQVHEAFYQFPYVAHVCLEPMNCTADYRKGSDGKGDTLAVWIPSQFPAQVKEIAENLLGVKQDNVNVTLTRMGGAFGRRAVHDFAAEAMAISYRAGLPVKLTWTRTDDIHNDFFRVGGFENMKAALDANGKLKAWDQHYIGFAHNGKPVIGSGLRGNEFSMAALDNARVTQTMMPVNTPCGAWRAPGSNTNAFVEQSFIHELAVLADRDHVEFMLELLGSRRWIKEGNVNSLNTGRAIDVIKLVAAKAGWGRSMPAGTGLGFAFYFCHAAHVAEIAEVTVDKNRNFRVNKVTVAVDVGPIINMSGATSQVQGAVIDGLSAMALQQITMQNGVIQQNNFDDYPVMRIASTPEIDVHFLQSDNRSTGLGEPALPPLAPAITNAIYTATGVRIRSMPLSEQGFKLA
ncbi:molybdopterin-dependent oxidoreductase [Pseudomonadales bacterium]|nr:molybdopterin-dependent oxidoreductase [Pseudomonadales bacterium]MDB4068812.1 molybdopterin-dependent oxidoreductase [Pseudomonadales bacterium]MDB9942759.1 molybdopterin-dependent oxidoreductase [Pseudomonadales bacterium]MDC1368401.1 molybdopterin-dependent oxidoreductase [Pseudomonadales bacterium]